MIGGQGGDGRLRTVVTYLQLLARPGSLDWPAPDAAWRIERRAHLDLEFYRFLYNGVGEPWLWWERRVISDAALAAIIDDPGVDFFLLYRGGEPAGYVELDRRGPADVEVAYCGLLPAFVGQGAGRYLLAAALKSAFDEGARRVCVDTCGFDHPRAPAFYRSFGFAGYKTEEIQLPDPRLAGILPMDAAPHVAFAGRS